MNCRKKDSDGKEKLGTVDLVDISDGVLTAPNIGVDPSTFDGNLVTELTDLFSILEIIDNLVLGDINVPQVQSDWNETTNTEVDYIKNKPTIPVAQVNSDWNATTGLAKILNKPTIPAAGILDLGSLLTTNATFKGVIINGDIDSFTCNAGDLMQMQASGLYIGANAISVNRTYMLAIATSTGNTSTIPLLTYGQFCLTSWNWTPNLPIYVSLDSGIMTQTPPMSDISKINVCVGYALSADTIFFNPYIDWDQIAGDVLVNATGFNGNLATTDVNVQMALQKLDDLALGGGGSAALVNIETISTTKTLIKGDKVYQYLNPSSTLIIVNIPTTNFIEGDSFYIFNNFNQNSDHCLQIQFSGVNAVKLYAGASLLIVFDGSIWRYADEKINDYNITLGKNAIGWWSGIAIGNAADAHGGGVAIGMSSTGYTDGVAIGNLTSAYDYGTAIGVLSNTNNKKQAIAIGYNSKCERYNEFVINASTVDTQKMSRNQVSWYGTTANNTQTELFLGGTSPNRMILLTTSCIAFKIDVTAIKLDGSQGAGYNIEGVIRRDNANNTVFVGTPVVTVLGEDNSAWDVIAVADNTNEALVVKVTGAAATSITWHAAGYFTEVRI